MAPVHLLALHDDASGVTYFYSTGDDPTTTSGGFTWLDTSLAANGRLLQAPSFRESGPDEYGPGMTGGIPDEQPNTFAELDNRFSDDTGARPLENVALSTGTRVNMRDRTYSGQNWEWYLADSDAIPTTLAGWGDPISQGKIDGEPQHLGDESRVELRGRTRWHSKLLTLEEFAGFEYSVLLLDDEGGPPTKGNVTFGDTHNPGSGSFGYGFWIKRLTGDLGNSQVVIIKGDGSTDGIRLRTNAMGDIVFDAFGFTTNDEVRADGALNEDAEWQRVDFGHDSVASEIWIAVEGAKVATEPVTGSHASSTSDFIVGSDSCKCYIHGLTIYGFSPTVEQLAVWWEREIDKEEVAELYISAAANWTAENGGTNGTLSNVTPVYSVEGQRGADEDTTKPKGLGTVLMAKPYLGDPTRFGYHTNEGGHSALTVYARGVAATAGFDGTEQGWFEDFSPSGIPAGSDEDNITAAFTCTSDTYVQCLFKILLDSGIGPFSSSREGVLEGPPLDMPAGFWWPRLTEAPNARAELREILRGAGCVLRINPVDGTLDLVRVPFEPFAVDDSDVVELREGVDFFEHPPPLGDDPDLRILAELVPYQKTRVAYSRSWGTLPDSDNVATDDTIARLLRREFLTAEHKPVASTTKPSDIEPPVRMAHYNVKRDAGDESQRVQLSNAGLRDVRHIRIDLSRKVAGLKFGTPLSIYSNKLATMTNGAPYKLTSRFYGTNELGTIEAVAMKRWRVVPTTVDKVTLFTATLDQISDDPTITSSDFGNSTSDNTVVQLRTTFPPLKNEDGSSILDTSQLWLARVRVEAIGAQVQLNFMTLQEDETIKEFLNPFVIAGQWSLVTLGFGLTLTLQAGEIGVIGAVFDPTNVVDQDEMKIQTDLFIETGATGRIYGHDIVAFHL